MAVDPQTRTIVDIGCNAGFFSLFCADETAERHIEGLAIDANPEMAEETRWHLQKNGLTRIDVIHGLAGAPREQLEGTFYVSPVNIASSVFSSPNPNLPKKGELKAIQVPTVDLAKEWQVRYGRKRIDILKIDVEGYEKELVKNSTELLALADKVAVDIHKWVCSPQEIESLLKQNGFMRYAEEGESIHSVVGLFRRIK
jgi:FkbM family methyltransferase